MNLMLDLDGAGPRDAPVRRLFLGWDEPFLPAVARRLALEYGADGELRMSAGVVVVPGARAGRRLKELLLAESERAGRRLEPPRIVTVSALPELLHEPGLPLASEALSRRAWAIALRTLPEPQLRELFPSPPARSDVRGWTRLARTIEGLHREVSGAGLSFSDVAARAAEDPIFDDAGRWKALKAAQARYAALLESVGFADAGLSRIGALSSSPRDPGVEIWLAGVVEMPGVAKALLHRIHPAVPVRVLVHAPESEADTFDELGCVVPELWGSREVEIPDEQLAVRGRPADQADEAVRCLARLGGSFAADDITIGVPDEEMLPFLEQRLGSVGIPVRRSTGGRMSRTPAVRLLEAMADYLDGNRFDACAALARHPDLWRWLRRVDDARGAEPGALTEAGGWVTSLDEHFSIRLPERVFPGRVRGSDRSSAVVGALCRALESGALLGRLRGTRRIGAWMQDILNILLEIYGETELDRAIPEQRELVEVLAAVRSAAAALHHLPPETDEDVDGATAIRLLVDDVAEQTIAPAADDAAVELLGWLEVHLDDAPVTVITGFNEGTLPESINAHVYLPDGVRTRLGLLDNQARYARDAYQLTALLRSKAELRLIAGRQTVRGDPLRPSRLMFATRGRRLAERVRRFYGGDSEEIRPAATSGSDDLDSHFVLPPEPRLLALEPIRRLSVRQFGAILTDPYLFAIETVLGLRPLDDAATELDGLGFGNLAHLVLQAFGESPAADSQDVAVLRAELDRILARVVEERHGHEAIPAVRLQVEQLRARLHAFARWQAGWAAEGWRIVAVECRTPAEGVELVVDGEPFAVTGRIDRIDYNPRLGAWSVFDYKTGDRGDEPDRTHRRGRGADRAWVDLQLPLYRHILPHVLDAAGNRPFDPDRSGDVRLGYVLLPRDPDAAGASFAGWSDAELEEAGEAARDVVRFVRRGDFVWDPDLPRRVRDPRLAALLGIGYLEAAVVADEAEVADA